VGACVGMKGSRVQMVVQELKGERIDIIPYSNDRSKFVQNSLKPAEVESVDLNEEDGRATLVVRDDQLSLAIGKGGLNAKLASELTGLEIDIVSVSELEASERETREMLMSLPGADEDLIETLMSGGVFSYEDILDYEVEGLVETLNLDQNTAESLYEASRKFVAGEETPSYLLEEEEKPADIDQKVEGEPEQEPVAEESSEKEEPSEASAEENQETEEPTSVG
ncbi:MAG: KH domain-containing protein, partial [Candidatus Omnitrophica bacterium]|nr:KH domain-containing protein [Candidatus Omnitrophota bacterium]